MGKTQSSEAQIAALIEKKASARPAGMERNRRRRAVAPRILVPLAERLDNALQGKLIRASRHTWSLETILEEPGRGI